MLPITSPSDKRYVFFLLNIFIFKIAIDYLAGITLVVSPLLSLIDDQIIALKKIDIDAVALNSSNNKTEGKRVYDALINGKTSIKLIYVTPEWLAKSKRFMTNLQKCYNRKGLDRIAIGK